MNYLFCNIADEEKNALMNSINVVKKNYLKGDFIFKENDTCNNVCIITKGNVAVKNLFPNGKEVIIRLLSESDSFGEGLLFSDTPLYKGSFIAQDDVEIEMIKKEDIQFLLKKNHNICLNLLKRLNSLSIQLMTHIRLLNSKKVSSKVAFYFYLLFKKYGNDFNLELNQTEIAQYLNVERPTYSKEFNLLIKSNIISYSHKQYTILDEKKLIERI